MSKAADDALAPRSLRSCAAASVIDDVDSRAELPDGVEIRAESPYAAATRALLREYLILIQERLGPRFQSAGRVLASERVSPGEGGAWLVLYAQDRAVACGGLRPLEAGVAEIRRMFVGQRHRRNGHGRRLLRELERIAVELGYGRVRLLTTEVLSEARMLYAAEGYRVVRRVAREHAPVEIWLEKDVP